MNSNFFNFYNSIYIEGHSRCSMGIEKIKGKVEGISNTVQYTRTPVKNRVYMGIPQDSTSFTGAGKAVGQASKSLSEFLLDIMPDSIKKMVSLHEGMGEVQNQMINAIGTGLVAPLFIKYNPISDTDQDTRTYTAWRQPVSAVLAICTQAAIVVPFNALIRKLSDIGYLGMRYNATLFPSDKYVEKLVKKANPNKHYSDKEMKKAIEEYNKINFAPKLKEMIEKDEIVFNTTDGKVNSTLKMPKEDFKKLFIETIDNIIADEKLDRDNLMEVQFKKKMKRSIFYKEHPAESEEILTRLQEEVNSLLPKTDYNSNTTNITVSKNKEFDEACKELIKDIKKNNYKKDVKDGLIEIVKEIKRKNTTSHTNTLRSIQDKIDKMIASVKTMERMRDSKEIMEYVNEIISRRTSAIDATIAPLQQIREILAKGEITVQQAQEIINNAIEVSENAVKQKLGEKGIVETEDIIKKPEWLESAATRLKSKVSSIADCIADNLKKHVKSNIDGYKRWTGLAVSLAILPVTCWLLNKIYPWFMDKAFPELSNKAASAKAKKNQKAEVK